MFYKKFENGEWQSAETVQFPTGERLDENNKEPLYGWEWLDEEPQDCADYFNELKEKENDNEI